MCLLPTGHAATSSAWYPAWRDQAAICSRDIWPRAAVSNPSFILTSLPLLYESVSRRRLRRDGRDEADSVRLRAEQAVGSSGIPCGDGVPGRGDHRESEAAP